MELSNKINRINQLVKDGKLEEAIIRLEALLEVHYHDVVGQGFGLAELYSLLCKLYTKAGRKSDIPKNWIKKAKEVSPKLGKVKRVKREQEKSAKLKNKRKFRICIISFSDVEQDSNRKLRWGDYWVKHELEKELQSLGHIVTNKAPDIILHLFGVPIRNVPNNTYNVLWIHSHPDWITPQILENYDKIFCLSPLFTEKMNSCGLDAELLIVGTSKKPVESKIKYDIVFVGNTKGKIGRKIIRDLGDLSKLPYNLKVWGEGWKKILPEKCYGGLYYDNQKLGELYASSLISLNDHHDDMKANGFINPRILDILASGGFCISDDIAGLEKIFEDTVPRYKTAEELRKLIDYYITNPNERLKLMEKGRKIALKYSFEKIAKQILESIESQEVKKVRSKRIIKSKEIIAGSQSGAEEIKLDVCGGRFPYKAYKKGYLNVDIQKLPQVDIVTDVRKKMPFHDNCVTEIFSCGTLEHFSLNELKEILKEFHRILKPQGKLVIGIPNFKKICNAYISNEINFEMLNQYLYGAQRTNHDFHKSIFDFENMKSCLSQVGFYEIEEATYDLPFHIPKYMMKIVCKRPSEKRMRFTGEQVIEGDTPMRIWLDHIERYKFVCRYVRGKTVLDIACGTGYGSQMLCNEGTTKVIGMDISKEVIDFARSKYKANNLELKVGNILNITSPKSYFDMIVCLETIEHIKNQQRALSEIFRVLKPGGLLIISSPNRKLTSPGKSIKDLPDNPFHTVEYSTKEFVSVLKNHFEILEVYGQRGRDKSSSDLYLDAGSPEVEKIQPIKEYRYIVVVCKKPQIAFLDSNFVKSKLEYKRTVL